MPKTHGKRYTKLYHIWSSMKDRCINPRCKDYDFYGGRGVKVCEEWIYFENFDAWAMKNGYKEGLSIDRIDNHGDYCPENCRWITIKEQCYNRRSNHYIEYNGKIQTITQWAEEYGMTEQVLSGRLRKGWDMESALTKPLKLPKKIEYNDKLYTVSELAKKFGFNSYTITNRLRSGWTIEQILNTPEDIKKKGDA